MLPANKRVVMITGANRGIGRAIAETLSAQGFRLSLGVRNNDLDLTSFANDVIACEYEARDPQSAQTWVQRTFDHFGAIDSLVLNAGVLRSVGVTDGSEEDLDYMWDVNFKGPLKLVRAAWPHLKKCHHARVINVVSLSGKRVMSSSNLGYCASKFAALSLTHAIRQEGWSEGLRATAICPGIVDTDMVSDYEIPAGQFKISPDTIAATASYALSLPNDAVVAEILVNSRFETQF